MEFLRNKRILAIMGIGCLFIGIITPYFQFSLLGYSYSISLWKYWEGKIIIALIVLNTMFIFKDFLKKYIPQIFNSNLGQKIENANPKLSIIPTILVVAFVVYLTIHLDVASEYLKNGVGFYLLWLGIICLVGHAILYKKQNNQNYSNQSIQQPVQPQSIQNNVMPQQPNQTTLNESNIKYCPNCGKPVDVAIATCSTCGHMF